MAKVRCKCIATYIDKYGHTSFGNFIAMCMIIETPSGVIKYIICEPKSLKKRLSSTYYNLKKLPDDIANKYPIGYYTVGSHYKILKEARYVNGIENTKFYEKQAENPTYDIRRNTWYSRGYKLKGTITDTQQELYHL